VHKLDLPTLQRRLNDARQILSWDNSGPFRPK
jgi:hypothetical protein